MGKGWSLEQPKIGRFGTVNMAFIKRTKRMWEQN